MAGGVALVFTAALGGAMKDNVAAGDTPRSTSTSSSSNAAGPGLLLLLLLLLLTARNARCVARCVVRHRFGGAAIIQRSTRFKIYLVLQSQQRRIPDFITTMEHSPEVKRFQEFLRIPSVSGEGTRNGGNQGSRRGRQ